MNGNNNDNKKKFRMSKTVFGYYMLFVFIGLIVGSMMGEMQWGGIIGSIVGISVGQMMDKN